MRTALAEAEGARARWPGGGEWQALPLKYRDLSQSAAVLVTVWQSREGSAREEPAGGATLRLFNRKVTGGRACGRCGVTRSVCGCSGSPRSDAPPPRSDRKRPGAGSPDQWDPRE